MTWAECVMHLTMICLMAVTVSLMTLYIKQTIWNALFSFLAFTAQIHLLSHIYGEVYHRII